MSDTCCTVYSMADFMGRQQEFCFDEANQKNRQNAFRINVDGDLNGKIGSIKCGKKVDATICPQGHELGFVDG